MFDFLIVVIYLRRILTFKQFINLEFIQINIVLE